MSNTHVHLHKDKFRAQYDDALPSPSHELIVSGEVDGDYWVKSVKLVRAQFQGINKELILDIEAELSPEPDPGQANPRFLRTIDVSYKEQDASDQYLSVLVRTDVDQVQLRIWAPLNFTSAHIETHASDGSRTLVVSGIKPSDSIEGSPVKLAPESYGIRPDYWRIHVLWDRAGAVFQTVTPFETRLDLAGCRGTKGVEVWGEGHGQNIDLEPEPRR